MPSPCTYTSFLLEVTEVNAGKSELITYAGQIESVHFIGCDRIRLVAVIPIVKITEVTKYTGSTDVPKKRLDLISHMTPIERELRKPSANGSSLPQYWKRATMFDELITLYQDLNDTERVKQWIEEARTDAS